MADREAVFVGPQNGIKPLGKRASELWHLLHDQQHRLLFSGGSAGPGKTFNMVLYEVVSALRFAGTAGALFRSTAENLRKSTMVTFFEVCDKARLVPGRHYTFNESKNIVAWCNGSTTQFDYLAYLPRDPNYSRLGGRAYTRAGVDEANEVEEVAVDVLASRLRYRLTDFCHSCAADRMAELSPVVDIDEETGLPVLWSCYKCGTWTKGLVPKLLLTGNPGDYWTKRRFVFNEDGSPVELPPHMGKVLMLLDDNPDKAHVASYRRQLELLDDEYQKARLLFGDWLIQPRTGKEFLHAFRSNKHVERNQYRPDLALHFTFDFNAHPYITCLVAQAWPMEDGRWHCHFLQELCLKHPESHPEAVCRALAHELRDGRYAGHAAGCYVYGDASGKNRQSVVVDGIFHNYDMIERELAPWLHNYSMRVIRRNPNHGIVRDFCNSYLNGKLKCWVTFDPGMINTLQDMVYVKEAADGGILKVYEKDRATGVRYEKYGHCMQAHYYLTVALFPEEFAHFVRR
jgi:hypothetical protein